MNLSSAIDYLSGDDKYFIRQLGEKKAEALKLVLEVLKDNVDVDEWCWSFLLISCDRSSLYRLGWPDRL